MRTRAHRAGNAGAWLRALVTCAAAHAILCSTAACESDPRACCEDMDFDAHYRAEFGEGHDPEQARVDCEDAGGSLSAGACSREDVVGQCVHARQHDEEHQFIYRELYLVGFASNDYDTQQELDALAQGCVELRGGEFVAGAEDE